MQITVDGTVVKVYIKPTPSGLSVDVSPPSVVTVIVRSDNKAVTISSPDGCLYIFIDLKTISVAPLYILNMKSRVLKDLPIIGPDGGYCGAQPADTATVTDNSTWLFTESQVLELCDLCSAGGAQIIPPGCPGAAPPLGDPVGLPRCSFADAIVERDDNIVRFECTGTVQARMPGKGEGILDFGGVICSVKVCLVLYEEKLFQEFRNACCQDRIANNNLGGDDVTLEDNDCVFGYDADTQADRLNCTAICSFVAPGSTCKGRISGGATCNGDFQDGACSVVFDDGACWCGNIPDSLAQQEGPTVDQLLDLNDVDDDDKDAELERVIKICTGDGTNFLTGARAGFNKLWFQNQRSVLSLYFFPNGKKCWTEEGWRGVLQKCFVEEVLQKCFEGCVWKKCCRKFCRGEVFTGNWSMVAWGVVWEWFGEEVLRK